jgi:glycosyltransferase involved in cell wall biosynthesis
MQVTYFQRRRRPNANFSLEFIFENVRECLKDRIQSRVAIAPTFSNGVFRRLWIGFDAMFRQGRINHVTGDINFVALFLSRKRTVLTILDCGFLNRPPSLRRFLIKMFWLDFPLHAATVVTTISEHAKSEIVKLSGCDPRKVVVIPVAISEKFQPHAKSELDSPPRLLQIGTAYNKNIPRLIEALRDIPCVLVIVGVIDANLQKRLHDCNITYENYLNLNQDDLVDQYRRADVIAYASTYEGFGMPIVEAQAVGRPVVTSNTSSMPDVAGDAACLVDPLDISSIRVGIRRVLEDSEFRRKLVQRGYANAKRFDAQKIAEQYLSVYQQVANGLIDTRLR